MVIAKKCDICGDFYLPYNPHNQEHTYSKEKEAQLVLFSEVKFSRVLKKINADEYMIDIDLCPDCAIQELADLSKAITNLKKETPNG